MGIQRAERSLLAHVFIDPRLGDGREVGTGAVSIELVAGNAGPRGDVIVVRVTRSGDVMKPWKLSSQPRAGVILIGDRVDPELVDDSLQVGRPRRADLP